MKKMIVCFIAVLAMLLLISGCTQSPVATTTPAHVHEALPQWDRDFKEHWHPCGCGEMLEVAAHTLEDGICTVCGSEVLDFGDSAYVYDYNEHEDLVRNSTYEDGELTVDAVTEYEYDDAGNYVTVKHYDNGYLYQEDAYVVNAEGENLLSKSINYAEFSYTIVTEYDEHENPVTVFQYDEDGVLIIENHTEFDIDEDGAFYVCRSETIFEDNSKNVETYNTNGDVTSSVDFIDGEQVAALYHDYQYDEEGRTIYHSTGDGKKLHLETFYGVVVETDGWYTYMQKTVVYNDDGTKNVMEYNENEELIKQTLYDAEGNVIE